MATRSEIFSAFAGVKSATMPASSTASEVEEHATIEAAAKAIYRYFPGAEAHPWVEGGNSFKQDEARRYARAALAAKTAKTNSTQPLCDSALLAEPASQHGAIQGAPLSAYSHEDQAFYRFWYGHMKGDVMTGVLANVSHSTARYIWDAALRIQADGARDARDAERYDYLLTCDYVAAKKYLPDLDEAEHKAKLRAKHDAAIAATQSKK